MKAEKGADDHGTQPLARKDGRVTWRGPLGDLEKRRNLQKKNYAQREVRAYR